MSKKRVRQDENAEELNNSSLLGKVKALADQVEGGEFSYVRKHFSLLRSQKKRAANQKSFASLNPPQIIDGPHLLVAKHDKEKELMLFIHSDNFERFWYEMENGYSILLQGFGSKAWLLELFASCVPKLYTHSAGASKRSVAPLVCTVWGSSSEFDIQVLLDSLMKNWLGWSADRLQKEKRTAGRHWSLETQCNLMINDGESSRRCLVLVVHNLDAERLRAAEVQRVFSLLASCRATRFIATIDHLWASMLWTMQDARNYNFVRYDATTFVPYATETSNFSRHSMGAAAEQMAQASREVGYILKSLTSAHNDVLKELVMLRQRDPSLGSMGVPVSMLFDACSKKLWIKSEQALKQFLKEFEDQDLVTLKTIKGKEYIELTLDEQVIRKEILQDEDPGLGSASG
jgi:origin recognition complex subunit 2